LAQRRGGQIHPNTGPEKAFGKSLKEIREGAKLSQEELGFQAGFDRTYISLIERGMRSPTIRSVVKLSEALGVRPSGIVQRMETLLDYEAASVKSGHHNRKSVADAGLKKKQPA
jgi:transcriptional regulator with XRE-family HTH domain